MLTYFFIYWLNFFKNKKKLMGFTKKYFSIKTNYIGPDKSKNATFSRFHATAQLLAIESYMSPWVVVVVNDFIINALKSLI